MLTACMRHEPETGTRTGDPSEPHLAGLTVALARKPEPELRQLLSPRGPAVWRL